MAWSLRARFSAAGLVILAAFLSKLGYAVVLLAVAGPHGLHLAPTLAAVLAQCGLSAAKHAGLGTFTDVGTTYKLCRNRVLRRLEDRVATIVRRLALDSRVPGEPVEPRPADREDRPGGGTSP